VQKKATTNKELYLQSSLRHSG